MSLTGKAKAVLAGLALVALTACGTTEGNKEAVERVFDSFMPGKGQTEYTVSPAAVQQALNRGDGTLIQASVPSRNTTGLLRLAGANGPYRTYVTSDARSLIMVDGILTGTRGLGEDIMDTTGKPTRDLITGRQAGVANMFRRYLDVENHTFEMAVTCHIERGGAETVQAGVMTTQAIVMTERCANKRESFENTYWVASDGLVVKSRQWVSPGNGYLETLWLRR